MRCLGCKAWKNEKCLAGVVPYQSKRKLDGVGCCYNTRTIVKLMRENRRTNANIVSKMSAEELATWKVRMCPVGMEPTDSCFYAESGGDSEACRLCWLNWLNEDASY